MAQLILQRAGDTAGVARRIRIDVDGVVVARLRPGETEKVRVRPGRHSVQAKMDWTSSPPLSVQVAKNGRVRVEVSMPWSAFWKSYVAPRRALVARTLPSNHHRTGGDEPNGGDEADDADEDDEAGDADEDGDSDDEPDGAEPPVPPRT